jgi:hypothetical protein
LVLDVLSFVFGVFLVFFGSFLGFVVASEAIVVLLSLLVGVGDGVSEGMGVKKCLHEHEAAIGFWNKSEGEKGKAVLKADKKGLGT